MANGKEFVNELRKEFLKTSPLIEAIGRIVAGQYHLGYVKDGERIVKQVNGEIIEAPPLVKAIRYISIELNSLGYTMGPFTCDLPEAAWVAAGRELGKTEEMS